MRNNNLADYSWMLPAVRYLVQEIKAEFKGQGIHLPITYHDSEYQLFLPDGTAQNCYGLSISFRCAEFATLEAEWNDAKAQPYPTDPAVQEDFSERFRQVKLDNQLAAASLLKACFHETGVDGIEHAVRTYDKPAKLNALPADLVKRSCINIRRVMFDFNHAEALSAAVQAIFVPRLEAACAEKQVNMQELLDCLPYYSMAREDARQLPAILLQDREIAELLRILIIATPPHVDGTILPDQKRDDGQAVLQFLPLDTHMAERLAAADNADEQVLQTVQNALRQALSSGSAGSAHPAAGG